MGSLIGWLTLFLPFAWLGAFSGTIAVTAVCHLIAVVIASAAFYRKLVPAIAADEIVLPWREQGIYGGVASLAGILPRYLAGYGVR
jgi:hypothetical protein